MESPAFFIRNKGRVAFVARPGFTGTVPKNPTSWVLYRRQISKDASAPLIAIDGDGLACGALVIEVMKRLGPRRAEMWFMSHIETSDDVFDSFNMGIDKLLVPFHTVRSSDDLKDMHRISDSIIPVLFCAGGYAIARKDRISLPDAMDALVSAGFYKACVLDTDGSLDSGVWGWMRDEYPSNIPFADYPVDGFQMTIRPADIRGFPPIAPLSPWPHRDVPSRRYRGSSPPL